MSEGGEIVARKRWSTAEARPIVEAWRESGETLRTFARSRGIDPQRLWWWSRRLAGAQQRPLASPGAITLVPLRVRQGTGSRAGIGSERWLEVVLGTAPVRVPAGFDPAVLCALLRAVHEAVSC